MKKLYFIMAVLFAATLNLKAETYVTGDVFGNNELYIPQHVSNAFGEVEKGLSFVTEIVATSATTGHFTVQETAFQNGSYTYHVTVGDTFYVTTFDNYSEFSPVKTAGVSKALIVKSISNNCIVFEAAPVKK